MRKDGERGGGKGWIKGGKQKDETKEVRKEELEGSRRERRKEGEW